MVNRDYKYRGLYYYYYYTQVYYQWRIYCRGSFHRALDLFFEQNLLLCIMLSRRTKIPLVGCGPCGTNLLFYAITINISSYIASYMLYFIYLHMTIWLIINTHYFYISHCIPIDREETFIRKIWTSTSCNVHSYMLIYVTIFGYYKNQWIRYFRLIIFVEIIFN